MNVRSWYRRAGLVALATLTVVSFVGAAPATLNPLVPRAPQAGVAPAACAEGLAPAAEPRVSVREIPLPEISPAAAAAQAPPSASLRAALQDAQAALARNDRPAFNEALANARSLMATYPSGGERRAAEELVRIYDTAARLWDAQFESPFFDEASPEFQLMSGYSGWAEAVRRSTITDPGTGRRFYPAAESRDFLSRVAADRLRGLGLQAPVRVARADQAPRTTAETPGTPAVTQSRPTQTQSATRSTTRTTTPSRTRATSPTTSRSRATASRGSGRTSTRVAAATPGSGPRASRPRLSSAPSHPRLSPESRTPAAVSSPPASSGSQASPTTAAPPQPAAPAAGSPDSSVPSSGGESPAAGESPSAGASDTAPVDVPDATTTPATAGTDTSLTTSAGPIDPVPAPVPPSRSRSVILPAILILIGLGVLIVLFRASK